MHLQDHPLLSYTYAETDTWNSDDIKMYHQALMKYDKDFFKVGNDGIFCSRVQIALALVNAYNRVGVGRGSSSGQIDLICIQ